MSVSFLPTDYEAPVSSGFLKFKQGENKFRIITPALLGWIVWANKKPIRSKEKPMEMPEGWDKNKPRFFWSMGVWNYGTKAVEILEITQTSIQNYIEGLNGSADWGSPLQYDLTVTRTGAGMDTQYTCMPSNKDALPDEIKQAIMDTPINLEALMDGKDPFEVSDQPKQNLVQETSNPGPPVEETPIGKEDEGKDIPF